MLNKILGALILILVGVLMAYKFSSFEAKHVSKPTASLLTLLSFEEVEGEIKKDGHKLTLINFWASWCVPCLKEFPELLSLKKTYETQGLNLIFISADNEENKDAALAFLQKQGVDFKGYYKGSGDYETFDRLFPKWNGALPASMIYSTSGELLDSWFGETSGAEFEERIKKHLF